MSWSTIFSHVGTIFCLPGLNQYKAEDKVSCSRTEQRASSELQTQNPYEPIQIQLSDKPTSCNNPLASEDRCSGIKSCE